MQLINCLSAWLVLRSDMLRSEEFRSISSFVLGFLPVGALTEADCNAGTLTLVFRVFVIVAFRIAGFHTGERNFYQQMQ